MARIYLVDDHQLLRDMLRAGLEADGHVIVGEAEGPVVAVSDIQRLEPELVLLDLNLGARSGLEVLAELRRRRLQVPVLVVTMSEQPHDVAAAMDHGANGYLRKGASRDELRQAIRTLLLGGRHLPPTEAALAAIGRSQAEGESGRLSPRERQIAAMVCRGASSSEIAAQMNLSPKTVDTYRSRLMAKLGLSDVPALVRWAVRQGLVDPSER